MFRWTRRIGVCLLPCTPTWGGDMGSAGRRMRKAVIGGVVLAAGLLLAPWVPALAAPAQQWVLTARGGAGPVVTVALDTAGRLSLSVRRGATQVLQSSPIGVRTSAADLATGLRFTGRADTRVTGEYTTLTGRRRQHTVDANQTTLSFTKGASRLDLVFRVSTDGFGYRYVIRQSGAVNVTADTTELAVPTTARAVLLPYETGRNDYENVHVHTTVAQARAIEYGYPSLFRVGDTWLLLTESDLDGTYGGTRLTFSTTTHRFRVTLADTSWIKPGRSAWSWWSRGSSAGDFTAQKRYVDFAARMGWEYNLVDAGWSAEWMPELVAYARERNVGIFIWVHFTALDTPEERNEKLPLWHSWGVAGLKIDFIQSDSQGRMKWYDEIFAATAQQHLMIDFHGATIPRGTERTWPQVLTSEAVRGAEAIKPKPGKLPFPVTYYTTLPFARNLAGSMDFTPVTFTAVRPTSDAAELALSVLFESGLQNLADSIESYQAHPLALRFLRQVPAAWDETRLLSGNPDSHVVLARRHGTSWFVGAIFDGPARTTTTRLSFLPAGDWLADIYADGADRQTTLRTQRVTNAGSLSISVPGFGGGFSVQLCPAVACATSCSAPIGS